MCGRLWSSAVRRRFGERCPECEASAAQPAAKTDGPVSSSPGHPAGVASPADGPAAAPHNDALVR